MKIETVERSDGSKKIVESVLVTPKGLTKLAAMLGTNPPDCNYFPPQINGNSPRPHA